MSVQYTGVCAVQQGMFITPGVSWVQSGDIMSTLGDIMSTPGDIMINVGEGHWENNWICMETPVYWTPPALVMWSPTLMMVSPSVLMVSPTVLNTPRCTHDIPRCTHDIPQWAEHPRCTHDIPQCTEHPGVLSDIPQCTEHPPVYCTHPVVLHRHYAGWYNTHEDILYLRISSSVLV